MKIWAAAIYDHIHLFTNQHDFDLFMNVHYEQVWEQNMTDPAPDTWDEKRNILTSENIQDEDFVITHIQNIYPPPDPQEAFGCVYTFENIANCIEEFDPALHQEALEEWVRFERSSIEDNMSEQVLLPSVEELMDPGAFWRWDNETDDYESWALAQKPPA